MGAVKITKVIDYIGDYYILFGDGKSWYGIQCLGNLGMASDVWEILVWNPVFINLGSQFGHRYVIPLATRHLVQSSLKVQDGVSFFFQDGVSSACSFPPSDSKSSCPVSDSELTSDLPCCHGLICSSPGCCSLSPLSNISYISLLSLLLCNYTCHSIVFQFIV